MQHLVSAEVAGGVWLVCYFKWASLYTKLNIWRTDEPARVQVNTYLSANTPISE